MIRSLRDGYDTSWCLCKAIVGGFARVIDNPVGVTVDSGGNVYAANLYLHSVTKFTPAGSGSTFVNSGLESPSFILAVPEPSTTAGLVAMVGVGLGLRRWLLRTKRAEGTDRS